MDKDNSIKRLEILLRNACLLVGDYVAVKSYTTDPDAILAIENINLRRVAAEIYVLAQSIGNGKFIFKDGHFQVS